MMLKIKKTASKLAVLRLAALSQALLLLFVGMSANAQEGNRLQDIQVQSLPGQRVELKLIMTGTAPDPLAFTIDNPARIALDLPDTALGLSSRRRDVNLGPLATVLTAEANVRWLMGIASTDGRIVRPIDEAVNDTEGEEGTDAQPVADSEPSDNPPVNVDETNDEDDNGSDDDDKDDEKNNFGISQSFNYDFDRAKSDDDDNDNNDKEEEK